MAGDSIVISVWGYPEFTTRTLVNLSGRITLPLIGEVMAAGLTREDFRNSVRSRLAEFIQGEIKLTVGIISPLPRITVLGSVSRTGSFPANTNVPLVEVLSNAGGWTDQSDLRYIKIIRQTSPGSEGNAIEVNLESYLESGNIRFLTLVHPGDVVYVPRKENAIREMSDYLYSVFLLFGFFRLFN